MRKAKLCDLLTEAQKKEIILKSISVDTMVKDLTVNQLHTISEVILVGKGLDSTLASQALDELARTAFMKGIPIL